MADYPLRSATDRCLGRPLPHQLANQTQAHPIPINLWPKVHVDSWRYEVLIPVSRGYPSVWGRLPTRYSPVRRSLYLHLTEISFKYIPLDLHVLGTPPAFILSQDQTLNKWYLRPERIQAIKSCSEKRVCVSLLFFNICQTYIAELLLFSKNCTRPCPACAPKSQIYDLQISTALSEQNLTNHC